MPQKTHPFPRTRRLSGKRAFTAVYETGAKRNRMPLVLVAKPTHLPHSRWGLSVSRRVGTAPKRNRIKRLLRESIRLMTPDMPTGYDLIIIVRPHSPLALADYQRLLADLIHQCHARWQRGTKK